MKNPNSRYNRKPNLNNSEIAKLNWEIIKDKGYEICDDKRCTYYHKFLSDKCFLNGHKTINVRGLKNG